MVIGIGAGVCGLAGETEPRRHAVAQIDRPRLVRDFLDRAAIRVAGILAIPVHDVGIRHTGLITGHGQAGDERAGFHLALRVHVGNRPHEQEAPDDLHEVTVLPAAA